MADEETKRAEEHESDTFEDASENTPRAEPAPAESTNANGATNDVKNANNQPTTTKEPENATSAIRTLDGAIQNGDDHAVGSAKSGNDEIGSAPPRSKTLPPRPQSSHTTASTATLQPTISTTPSEPDSASDTAQTQPPKRNIFRWLSRSSSNVDKPQSTSSTPPVPLRQRTTSSASVNTQEEPGTRRSHRNSLQNRFKLVRLREEAGIESLDEIELFAQDEGSVDGEASTASEELTTPRQHRALSTSKTPASQPAVSDSLPPGTAAGIVAGPEANSQGEVDWDLWQELVYEGPTAVARTSPDELNAAITRGIPSAIRGVVWQVLAQSKSEELETVYRDLVARGKGMDRRSSDFRVKPGSYSRQTLDPLSRRESAPPTIRARSNERVTSSASSIESRESSPSNTAVNGKTNSSSIPEDDFDADPLRPVQTDPQTDERKRIQDQADVQRLEKTIRRDMGTRTSFSKFLMSANLQEGLFGICKAYALYDEDVGYAQGMNFIAMPLLFNMPEEEAFCLFVRLMNQYNLRDLFIQDMPGLHLHLYQFERLLEDLEPAVYCHLHRRGVTPNLYATQWFLTLFAYRFPLQLVLRIYDLILSQGLESAILKFGIVLMQKNAKALLEMKDMAALTTFLKERLFDEYIDSAPSATSILESGFFGSAGGIDNQVYRADALVQDACSIKITPELLMQYTTEWGEKMREEKETLAAADALRTANANLTTQNRSLTGRLQTSDTEHVTVASELVRTKVLNQQLSDENESLKVQVSELQTIVQAQPGEVEDRLRQEMDRIMKRNIEVQNENRGLEEAVAEMEKELISAKMEVAEANSELEVMRQKWTTISAMMSGNK